MDPIPRAPKIGFVFAVREAALPASPPTFPSTLPTEPRKPPPGRSPATGETADESLAMPPRAFFASFPRLPKKPPAG
jgi:hypothetical protein